MRNFFLLLFSFTILSCSDDDVKEIDQTFLNVKDFGAIPNDNNDDSNAILGALEEAKIGEIKKVFLPEGIYLISKTLYLSSNVEFYGEGMDQTIIKNHPDAVNGLDIITPIDGILNDPDIWSNKTMISTEGADIGVGTMVENVKIHSFGIDWNNIGGGMNSILPIMIGRANFSEVYNVKIHDALDGDLKDTNERKQGLSILFAFSNDCELYDSFIGAADYESVSVRFLSKRTKIHNNTIWVNKPENYSGQSHILQVARPSAAVGRMQELYAETLVKDTYVEDNTFILERGTGHAITSHNSEGFFVRNNEIKFLSTLGAAWGIKPFSNTINVEISGNTIDVTEFSGMQKGITLISTGTSLGTEGIQNAEIFNNTIKIKNTEPFTGNTVWGFQSIIGSTSAYNKNISIHDNVIEIDGYENSQLPMIACSGENIRVINNEINLVNPLEPITEEGPAFFVTYGAIDMEVTGNYISGTIGRGFVALVQEGRSLQNVMVDNDYENCVGEEMVLNGHPDSEEVNQ